MHHQRLPRHRALFQSIFFLLILGFVIGTSHPWTADAASPPSQLWVSNGITSAKKVMTDSAGNVYVTGSNFNGTTLTYTTIKYDPNGNQLWTAIFAGDSGGEVRAMVLDSSGNVYVTGSSIDLQGNPDYMTVKYDSNGNQQWVARYDNGGIDDAIAIAVDLNGNAYVTGQSDSTPGQNFLDYVTIKYDSNGNQLWVARYDSGSPLDSAVAVAVDPAGNVYVTGGGGDFATLKYSSSGTQLWVALYSGDGIDNASALVLDGQGNVYVTGRSQPFSFGGPDDYATVKYNTNGQQLWVARFNNGNADEATAIAADGSGNVYVTGYSCKGSGSFGCFDYDYATVKYDINGNQLWVAQYDRGGGSADLAQAISLDSSGNIYVTGESCNGSSQFGCGPNHDYSTVKYDTNGNELWTVLYDSGGDDQAVAIWVDSSSNIYVTGHSATVKYGQGPNIPPYVFGGFRPPVSENGVYQLGRTLPVKFSLSDANGAAISNAVANLSLQKLSGSNPVGDPVDAGSSSAADSGNLFRFDGSQYIFNLDTRPLSAGTWQLKVALNDGSTHTVQIGLKAK